MSPTSGPPTASDRLPMGAMMVPSLMTVHPGPVPVTPDSYAKDSIISWFRGEFAAANAIIDSLCHHLAQVEGGGGSEYQSAFAAIHRRRLNWIPILQMQKYYSIADVSLELGKVAETRLKERDVENGTDDKIGHAGVPLAVKEDSEGGCLDESIDCNGNDIGEVVDEDPIKEYSPESVITDSGSQDVQPTLEDMELCSNHAECDMRQSQIKITKGFVAKEPVKGHMINVVRGLNLYEDVFGDTELSKLTDFVNELRAAGRNGELPGDTFILYNQQLKGNRRELIQLGAPIFGQIREEKGNASEKCLNEPIPALLHGVINHLVQWRLISENRKPNGCIINFFDEGEYSQPFLKPPHLDLPILTLVLSDSTIAFGRALVSDGEGNYRAPLMLTLKEGSLLVMKGNSADMARHVMCPSPNKRASITFIRVRAEKQNNLSTFPPSGKSMTLWQPGVATLKAKPSGMLNGYERINAIAKWGVPRPSVVMLTPVCSMISSSRRIPNGGTGVFFPWTGRSRKYARHIPPRARRGKLLELPPPVETHNMESSSSPGISNGGKVA